MKLLLTSVVASVILSIATAQPSPPSRAVIVASKPFGESYVLCEMFAQLLEARGLRVDRRPGLGASTGVSSFVMR